MKRSDGSAPAAFPRCSPSAWRTASSAAALVLLLAACGGTALSPGAERSPGPRDVPFTAVASSQMARHDAGPALVVATDDGSRAILARSLPDLPAAAADRVHVAAFQGEQRTGGYGIQITRVERDGDRLLVYATFAAPPAGSLVTQVITSPAQVVSIARADTAGVRTAVLLDASGTERARASVT